MNRPPLVIYHGGCRDGFAAAWATRRGLGGVADFHVGYYGHPVPDVAGRDVIMVDFAYKRAEMERIVRTVNTLLVLDHHVTARDALLGLDHLDGHPWDNIKVEFDMLRSGAGMAWDHYFPGQARPWLIDYVEDRDLWRKSLKDSEEINAFIGVLPYDFEVWDDEEGRTILDTVIERGDSVLRKVRQYVEEVLKVNTNVVVFEGYKVPIVNCPQVDISEVLAELVVREVPRDWAGSILRHRADGSPLWLPAFAMGWWQRADGRFQYSMRSRSNGSETFDVGALAKKYGGGGHKAAAGFENEQPFHLWL